jgi:hypothetical protein
MPNETKPEVVWSQLLGWVPGFMNTEDSMNFKEECYPALLQWKALDDIPEKWRDKFEAAASKMKAAGTWRPYFDDLGWTQHQTG